MDYTIVLEYKMDNWIASYPEISPTLLACGDTKEEALQELDDMFQAMFDEKPKPTPRKKDNHKYKITFDIDLDTYDAVVKIANKTGTTYVDVLENLIIRQFGKKYHSLGLKLTSEYNELLEEIAERTSYGNKTDAVKRLVDNYLSLERKAE